MCNQIGNRKYLFKLAPRSQSDNGLRDLFLCEMRHVVELVLINVEQWAAGERAGCRAETDAGTLIATILNQ